MRIYWTWKKDWKMVIIWTSKSNLDFKLTATAKNWQKNYLSYSNNSGKQITLAITLTVCVKFAQSCLTFCDSMDCSPPGSSVHEILQARILEWFAMPFSRGSSWPRDRTCISCVSCIGRQILYHWRHRGSPRSHPSAFQLLEFCCCCLLSCYLWPHPCMHEKKRAWKRITFTILMEYLESAKV